MNVGQTVLRVNQNGVCDIMSILAPRMLCNIVLIGGKMTCLARGGHDFRSSWMGRQLTISDSMSCKAGGHEGHTVVHMPASPLPNWTQCPPVPISHTKANWTGHLGMQIGALYLTWHQYRAVNLDILSQNCKLYCVWGPMGCFLCQFHCGSMPDTP